MRPTITLPPGHPMKRTHEGLEIMFSLGKGTAGLVGDKFVSSPIYAGYDPGPHSRRPGYLWRFDVIDGVIRCSDFQVWTERPEQFVRLTDVEWAAGQLELVRTIAIAGATWVPAPDYFEMTDGTSETAWAAEATVAVASVELEEGKVYILPKDSEPLARVAPKLPRPGNRSLTDRVFLARVADVYNANAVGGADAVQDAFDVSRPTAQRYVKAARDARPRLIEDRRRNRSTAKEG
jgi:hypothetical protein